MTYNRISKKAIKSWIISRLIICIILMLIYGAGMHIILLPRITDQRLIYLIYSVTGGLLLFLVAYIFAFPIIEYKEWRYSITDERIDLIYGIFIRKHMVIPISRIQYMDVEQGPINRCYGLVTVIINTAGGVHEIPALTEQEAEKVSSRLTDVIQSGDRYE
ncbi:PH domain-containing protein [Wukongibacter baidiensis]|uniref:PH domain-containing protein n=1 Tax=Wukongibacter baidiensis TaxID=1723361 RepID=UPI003D7F7285